VELISAFKDHLVDWVEQYLFLTHDKHEAECIMDDIDHRYVICTASTGTS